MKKYYGNYLGLCINNNDPDKRGRVQVFIPHIMPSLYRELLNEDEDLKIVCVGDNLPDSLPSSVIEKLIKVLPWAEAASPILGTSSAGSLISQAVGAVKNFFNQSPVTNPCIPTGPNTPGLFSPTSAPTPQDRSNIRSQGGIVVNLDTNWAGANNQQTQPLVVIPDNATQAQREQAQAYANAISQAYAAKFNSSLPGKVLTRSENGRGRNNTIHTEPFAVTDTKAAQYFTQTQEGRQILANITRNTLGQIPGVVFAIPHGGVGGLDQGAVGSLGSEVDFARILVGDIFGNSTDNNNLNCNEIETTSTGGQASTFNAHQSDNPTADATGDATFAQPIVMSLDGAGPTARTTTASQFAANNDGNTRVDRDLSNTYLPNTASGIPNDSEILGYTIPLDASLESIARDKTGQPVASVGQPAIVTFRTSSGQEYRVLAVGNDTGGRQVGGNPLVRDWGEFGTNTFRELQRQGLNVQLAKNSLSLPDGTTATYEFLNGNITSVDQYRALQNELAQSGRLDPSQFSTPIDNGAAAVGDRGTGMPDASSMVMNTDKNGPTAVLNINNMAKGVFTYPAAGALLWVFFREGDPLFPVYFAASYGEREWQSAFRQGSDTPGYKPGTDQNSPIVSTGTVLNWGVGGIKVEDTTDPTNYKNNQKSVMLYGSDGSNMFFNEGYHQIFSKFDRRDQVEGDRFNSTLGIKEELVQSDSNSIVMGDQVIKVGNITPETIQAAQNIQNSINKIMAPLTENNPPIPSRKNLPISEKIPPSLGYGKSKYFQKAIADANRRFNVPAGPYKIPVEELLNEIRNNLTTTKVNTPTPQETLNRINTGTSFATNEIVSEPIKPPTPPKKTE